MAAGDYHYGRPVADPDFDLVRAAVAAERITSGRRPARGRTAGDTAPSGL